MKVHAHVDTFTDVPSFSPWFPLTFIALPCLSPPSPPGSPLLYFSLACELRFSEHDFEAGQNLL